ncbi:hypothetical protein Y032_0405g865 [Ancylostoma ceylanicum]|uniref:Uncharacterized protein n=1 Tax=Ancylostoma ceylanicum TaxID=53326 RepID=A0A016X2N8_9BILA|nr:hypothetical protein Y032_0405g865 [Ancylostoma ceylanicum]
MVTWSAGKRGCLWIPGRCGGLVRADSLYVPRRGSVYAQCSERDYFGTFHAHCQNQRIEELRNALLPQTRI